MSVDQLGRADQVRVTADRTAIIASPGHDEDVEFRLTQLRAELERATFGVDEDVLTERIGALSGKVAVIRVGAPTNAELKELQHRVEDALSATRAAMAEGIVAGGGVALLHAASALDDLEVKDDYAIGVEIVRRALTEPTYLIAANAGYNGLEVLDRIGAARRRRRVRRARRAATATCSRWASSTRSGSPARRCRTARRWPACCSPPTRLIAEEQTPWGGSAALMTEFGPLDEGLHQPSPDPSTPQSLGLGPSVG